MTDKALNMIGLMRKANAVQIGETDTGAAARAKSAKLVILAKDASENAVKRAEVYVYGRTIPLIKTPFTKQEISEHVGKNGCSMAAICDLGFADAFIKLLNEISPGEYSEAAMLISEKLEREKRRKHDLTAQEKNKRTGKRRNNA